MSSQATMPNKLVECVPNFSEGCDRSKIQRIADAIEAVPSVKLLHVDPGRDANRTVMTFVGNPESVAEAAFKAIATAAQLIDMRRQRGTHPRIGATDVCPFVPLQGTTIDECVEIAQRVGRRVGDELGIPVYLYEAAGRHGRRNLADIRRGEYEGLADKIKDPFWEPDYGPARFNARSGATVIGAREFLIAYNITLNTRDKLAAADIAHELRERGRFARTTTTSPFYYKGEAIFYQENHFPCGNCAFVGTNWDELCNHCQQTHDYDLRSLAAETIPTFPQVVGQKVRRAGQFKFCKALGWYADAYGRAQISTNLTNYHVTPPHLVLEAARRLAAERGLVVTGSEVIGLIPYQAMLEAGRYYLQRQGRSPHLPIREVLETAVHSLGLNDVQPFDLEKKLIGAPSRQADTVLDMPIGDFLEGLSCDETMLRAGALAALCGAIAAALASMIANLTHHRAYDPSKEQSRLTLAEQAQHVKQQLLDSIVRESEQRSLSAADDYTSHNSVTEEHVRRSVNSSLEIATINLETLRIARKVSLSGHPALLADATVACELAYAGIRCGLGHALVELRHSRIQEFIDQVQLQCVSVRNQATSLLRDVEARLNGES